MSEKVKKVNCSALCLDIRKFTPTLKNNSDNPDFYNLIKLVYCAGLYTAQAFSGDKNSHKRYYFNSTGDGFICVFLGQNNFLKAYLMSVILYIKLPALFEQFFGKEDKTVKFGIGVESGKAVRVLTSSYKPNVDAYLGEPINLASRIESKTKDFTDTPVIIGEAINDLLSKKVLGFDYEKTAKLAKREDISIGVKERLDEEMNSNNHKCLLEYLHGQNLKGYEDNPKRLYKFSKSLIKNLDINTWEVLNKSPQEIKDVFLALLGAESIWD